MNWRVALTRAATVLGAGLVAFGLLLLILGRPRGTAPDRLVMDVTQLVRIDVERVVTPYDTEDVQRLVAAHRGPVSIGGGRFSMGGQIATDDTLFLDMRQMNDVLELDTDALRMRVEAGATWRQLQDQLDPHDLSIKIMQSYANFTVGGSLSVNAHGRYVNLGPVAHSVRSLVLVLADGRRLEVSRDVDPDLFFAAIGGYGALGVVTEVELDLARNEPVERTVARMPVGEFRGWFDEHIHRSDEAVFFNADLYPPAYDDLVAITYSSTDRDVTVEERLQPRGGSTATDRFTYWWVSEAPLGKQAREEVVDRLRLQGNPVVWRNFEASYDVYGLEPSSRETSTYVLQEYFVPVDQFDAFVPRMAEIFERYDVNVVNVSIRHATADPDTLLTWAPTEVFAFVIYYKQGTSDAAQTEVGVWTREMASALLEVGGVWYLPYQPHPTPEQFAQAYPRSAELFDLKAALDPHYVFRNKLWDRYLPAAEARRAVEVEARIAERLAARDDWKRPEDQTFLTLPEWYIVYSADELGAHLAQQPPSTFRYFAAIGQFWRLYGHVRGTIRTRYPANVGYHSMIWVIGVSYTVEYAIKGIWEGTVGRLTEWASGDAWKTTEEDRYYAQIAEEYGAFIHHTPWFAFDWADRRRAMPGGDSSIRSLERTFTVWAELAAKGVWGWAMGGASEAAYDPVSSTVSAWVIPHGVNADSLEGVEVIEDLGDDYELISVPRYEPFTRAVVDLASRGMQFVQIAGCRTLLVQIVADETWSDAHLWGDEVVSWPILTQPGKQRIAMEVSVGRLHEVLPALQDMGITIEHLYDY
ncbi:MAG: FAD-binding oxidoreductase [Myxococcales bacterium]|nr:FAD-binding oxidoreductase [Myxococcales bacterium]